MRCCYDRYQGNLSSLSPRKRGRGAVEKYRGSPLPKRKNTAPRVLRFYDSTAAGLQVVNSFANTFHIQCESPVVCTFPLRACVGTNHPGPGVLLTFRIGRVLWTRAFLVASVTILEGYLARAIRRLDVGKILDRLRQVMSVGVIMLAQSPDARAQRPAARGVYGRARPRSTVLRVSPNESIV